MFCPATLWMLVTDCRSLTLSGRMCYQKLRPPQPKLIDCWENVATPASWRFREEPSVTRRAGSPQSSMVGTFINRSWCTFSLDWNSRAFLKGKLTVHLWWIQPSWSLNRTKTDMFTSVESLSSSVTLSQLSFLTEIQFIRAREADQRSNNMAVYRADHIAKCRRWILAAQGPTP